MATTLVLARHGPTAWNREGRQGHADVPLDDIGIAQARTLASKLAALTLVVEDGVFREP